MKIITAKQEARLEKKKKKLAALAQVMKLNDKDRQLKHAEEHPNDIVESSSSTSSVEPMRKRPKLMESSDNLDKTILSAPESIVAVETVSTEDYADLKRLTNERKRNSRSKPDIRLNLLGDAASIKVEDSARTPIFLTDIQHLIMAALFGTDSPCSPSRWCVLEKRNRITHTVVLVIEGLALFHYASYAAVFEETARIFDHQLEVIMPPHQDGQIVDELMTAPLTDSQRTELIAAFGSLEAALEATQNQMLLVKTVFPIPDGDGPKERPRTIVGNEIVPRTQLLLSALQLVDEGYPVPLRGDLANRYKDFVMTKDVYDEVTPNSPMFGLDCEMCRTSAGVNELTRISIVDESYQSIYETLVRPDNKIIDYLTQYSGITCEMMANVTKTRSDVQQDIRKLLPADAILVGQSLQSDLLAMRMMHPYVIDTSVIFNITGERRLKSKLQTLAMEFLGEKIQANPLGHDSIEDCSASLKLTKLKLVKGLYFGDEVLSGRRRANEKGKLAEESTKNNSTAATTTNVKDTSTAIIISADTNGDTEKYRKIAADCKLITCYEVDNNKKAIKKTRDHCIENALTITHIKIPPQRLEVTKIEKTLSRVDRWIAGVWDSVAPNGLFVVVLGGVPSVISGVAMVQIKRNLKIVQKK